MNFDFSKIHRYIKSELYAKEYEIEISISALKELIENDEKSILSIQNEFEIFLSEHNPEDIPIQQRDYFEEHLIDRELVIKNLKIKKRYSSCLLIFSVFESILKEFCEEIERNNEFTIKIKDLRRSDDLTLYKNYLTKVYQINFESLNPSFTKIKHQKIVRNRISHRNGKATTNEIQIVDGLELMNDKIIITSKSYFIYLINLIDDFFKKLLIEIDKK